MDSNRLPCSNPIYWFKPFINVNIVEVHNTTINTCIAIIFNDRLISFNLQIEGLHFSCCCTIFVTGTNTTTLNLDFHEWSLKSRKGSLQTTPCNTLWKHRLVIPDWPPPISINVYAIRTYIVLNITLKICGAVFSLLVSWEPFILFRFIL